MSTTKIYDLKEKSLQLLQAYQEAPNADLRNQVVRLNLGLVRKEAHHWVNQCRESYDDLIQVGCLGLIRAIERFDLTQGCAFSSFATPYIRGEIQHYLRDKGCPLRIPRRWLAIKQKAASRIREFRARHNRQPTDVEIAQSLKISVEQWQEIQLACQNRQLISLDLPVGEEGSNSASLGDLVPDPQYRSFQLAQEDRIRLQQSLIHLEERTRDVLEFVFLHDLTQKETAEQLGISVVTVSRQVKKGLKALKSLMLTEL
ncbi:RNA polymerase sigma factor SigF [Lusitaniella coriacea LEGE 07157]|uniref:RNA polymerase sigma factor SigF n=1 Tax=Lusitaniella coriacea LEGE 07157 TaxID=945747 RepID=A0A8J7B6U5_9CYAN|nr:RNA polymerase sigma factor SigF [Lusitaniella coriacea]MBE9114616.1 RNA polymerase sigma factor SigF [Lusitaniella coriacea LEGE 07157]